MNYSRMVLASAARFRAPLLLGSTVFAVAVSEPFLANAAAPHTTIVLSDSPAPGFPLGALFQELSTPILNNAGVASFGSFITSAGVDSSNDFGFWVAAENGIKLGFRTGNTAPGLPQGSIFGADSLFPHTVDDSGRIGFAWFSDDDTAGVWAGTAGNLQLLARDGATATGLPNASPTYKYDLADVTAYQTNGGTVLLGSAQNGSADFPDILWRGQSSNLGVIARSYGPAASLVQGVVFDRISKFAVSLDGHVAFYATVVDQLGNGGIDSSNDSGLWSDGGGQLNLIVREGTSAPATSGTFRGFEQPTINQAGKIAFRGTLNTSASIDGTNDEGIWRQASGGLQLVAREGGSAPGVTGGVFEIFSDPLIGQGERVAFGGKLLESGPVNNGNDTGLWGSLSGTLSLVAREGAQAPGLPTGVLFGDLDFVAGWTANESGALAFMVDLFGSEVNLQNDGSLWAQWPDGSLALIAREGDFFTVAPGDLRRIVRVDFATGSELRASSLADGWNDNFQLAFHLEFYDGTEGLFMATIPEPTSAMMLSVGALLLMRRMRMHV